MPLFRRKRRPKKEIWEEPWEEKPAKLRGSGVHLMFSFTNPEERERIVSKLRRSLGNGYNALHFNRAGAKEADAEALNSDVRVSVREGPDSIGKEYNVKHYTDEEGHQRVEVMWFRKGLLDGDLDLRPAREQVVFKISKANLAQLEDALDKVRAKDPEGFKRLAELAGAGPEHAKLIAEMVKRRLKGLE